MDEERQRRDSLRPLLLRGQAAAREDARDVRERAGMLPEREGRSLYWRYMSTASASSTVATKRCGGGCAMTPISSGLMQAPILGRASVPECTLLRRGLGRDGV